ncbi:unnamed protein product [Pylaiella littoralis]
MESTGLRVEDHPLVVNYVSTRGGRPSSANILHQRPTADMVLIAHCDTGGSQSFTCNDKVTSEHPFGAPAGTVAIPKSSMIKLPAPGRNQAVPTTALSYAVNRFTSVGRHGVLLADRNIVRDVWSRLEDRQKDRGVRAK